MAQTKIRSWKEAWSNIFFGYAINFVVNITILPLFGFKTLTVGKNLALGVIYTGISLFRTYCIRRWFNRNDGKESTMTCKEAQNIALRFVNLKSDKVTIEEIKHALIVLANWYEDNKPRKT